MVLLLVSSLENGKNIDPFNAHRPLIYLHVASNEIDEL